MLVFFYARKFWFIAIRRLLSHAQWILSVDWAWRVPISIGCPAAAWDGEVNMRLPTHAPPECGS